MHNARCYAEHIHLYGMEYLGRHACSAISCNCNVGISFFKPLSIIPFSVKSRFSLASSQPVLLQMARPTALKARFRGVDTDRSMPAQKHGACISYTPIGRRSLFHANSHIDAVFFHAKLAPVIVEPGYDDSLACARSS